MTQKQLIDQFCKFRGKCTTDDVVALNFAYEMLAPRWISVEDELPPRWETNPNVSVPVITFGTLGESSIPCVELQRYHFGDGRWQYCVATHWMPFQYPKKGGAL